jgi:hypothetical protein
VPDAFDHGEAGFCLNQFSLSQAGDLWPHCGQSAQALDLLGGALGLGLVETQELALTLLSDNGSRVR